MTAGRQSVSATKHWCTPPSIVRSVKETFGGDIGLDPCSNEHSLVGAQREYILPDTDGLKAPWDAATIFVNPPYGSEPQRGTRIIHWFERITQTAAQGSEIIALVPVAPNTRHWKNYVFPKASAICFLASPRVRFFIHGQEDPKGAPMSCAVIYWGTEWSKFAREFRQHGTVIPLHEAHLPDSISTRES